MGKTFRRQKSWDEYDYDFNKNNKKKKFIKNKQRARDKTKELDELANANTYDFRYDE